MSVSTFLIRSLAVVGAFAASSLQGGATGGRWFLDSCPPENGAKAAAVRAEILSAAPGSSVYVPRPFPATDEQVIEDLEYQFLDLFSQDSPKEVPEDVRGALRALQRKSARFDVLEFVDWRSSRCGVVYGQTDFRFLVRVSAMGEERELARIVINNTGLLGTFATPQAPTVGREQALGAFGAFGAIESIDELRSRSGLAAGGSEFQYVALSGFSLRCSDMRPCIAFRASGRAFFSHGGKTYALDLDRPGVARVRPLDAGSDSPQRTAAVGAVRPGEHLVALGPKLLAVASPVPE